MKKLITIKKLLLAFTFIFICNSMFSQTVIDNENFEGGVFAGTIWNDGGSDCRIINGVPPNSNYALELTDNSGSGSSAYTSALDLSTYTSVSVTFDFQTSGFVGTDDFYLEYSINGGTTYIKIGDYNIDASGTQFTDGTQYLAENITDGFPKRNLTNYSNKEKISERKKKRDNLKTITEKTESCFVFVLESIS